MVSFRGQGLLRFFMFSQLVTSSRLIKDYLEGIKHTLIHVVLSRNTGDWCKIEDSLYEAELTKYKDLLAEKGRRADTTYRFL